MYLHMYLHMEGTPVPYSPSGENSQSSYFEVRYSANKFEYSICNSTSCIHVTS